MQRLNIPLSKHKKTTRRNRRVVWLIASLAVLGVVILWQMSVLWFTRPTTFAGAPDETILAIQLILNQSTVSQDLQLFEAVPLISNRSLTLEDLLEFTNGEIGWFFTEDGHRSIAIKSKEDLSSSFLHSFGIVSQRINSSVLLLSETLMPVGDGIKGKLASLFSNPFRSKLGQFVLPGEKTIHGRIFEKNGQIDLDIELKLKITNQIQIPENTILALATPALPNNEIESFVEIITNFFIDEYANQINSLFLDVKSYLLTSANNKEDFLIESSVADNTHKLSELLSIIAAVNTPSLKTQHLQDGSDYQELKIEPELTTIAEMSIEGKTVLVARLDNNFELFATEYEDSIIITTGQDLMSFWLQNTQHNVLNDSCNATIFYADSTTLLNSVSSFSIKPSVAFIASIFSNFPVISVESKNSSTLVHLCS